MTLGYTTNSANGWWMWGTLTTPSPALTGLPSVQAVQHGVDPFKSTLVNKKVKTTEYSTTITDVNSDDDAFADVVVGDLLIFNINGSYFERVVTARASADSITVNAAISIPSRGFPFEYKHLYYSTNPYDQMWISVDGYSNVSYEWSVDANANTGGVVTSLQCATNQGPEFPIGSWVEPRDTTRATNPTTTASGSTQLPVVESIDLTLAPFSVCKFGWKFGTGDDADGAPEDLNLSVVLRK